MGSSRMMNKIQRMRCWIGQPCPHQICETCGKIQKEYCMYDGECEFALMENDVRG